MLLREDYKNEIKPLASTIAKGENSPRVAVVQEWLNLHRYYTPRFRVNIQVDKEFGPATESAVKAFQMASKLDVTGAIDQITWMALTAPMKRAFTEINFDESATLEQRILQWGEQFVNEHPVEIQPNRGPWVRAFMKGVEGPDYAWCNGVVSTIIDHAAHSMGKSMDEFIPWTWSCFDSLRFAKSKQYKCRWVPATEVKQDPKLAQPGNLFLVLNHQGAPSHIGIVKKVESNVMSTYEGNTNDEGSREGYEYIEGRRDLSSGKYGIIKLQ